MHGGHRAKIPDFSWNPNGEFTLASIEEDNNMLQVWSMAKHLLQPGEARAPGGGVGGGVRLGAQEAASTRKKLVIEDNSDDMEIDL